jgi:FAD/FMN-containing dehydrogenase
MGDGNLHMNIMTTGRTKEIDEAIEPFVYEITQQREGSISAEHGLGQVKNEYLGYSKSAEFIDTMRQIKKVFDPHGILNPYKYFPLK